MTAKHTPGPWSLDGDLTTGDLDITAPGHKLLLEALQEVIRTWDSGSQAFPISLAREAIAQATGRPQVRAEAPRFDLMPLDKLSTWVLDHNELSDCQFDEFPATDDLDDADAIRAREEYEGMADEIWQAMQKGGTV